MGMYIALGTEYAQFVLLQSLVPWFYYVRIRNLKWHHWIHACSTVVVCDSVSKILIAIDWVFLKLMLPLLHRCNMLCLHQHPVNHSGELLTAPCGWPDPLYPNFSDLIGSCLCCPPTNPLGCHVDIGGSLQDQGWDTTFFLMWALNIIILYIM